MATKHELRLQLALLEMDVSSLKIKLSACRGTSDRWMTKAVSLDAELAAIKKIVECGVPKDAC